MGIGRRAFLTGLACFSRVASSFFGVNSLEARLRFSSYETDFFQSMNLVVKTTS